MKKFIKNIKKDIQKKFIKKGISIMIRFNILKGKEFIRKTRKKLQKLFK